MGKAQVALTALLLGWCGMSASAGPDVTVAELAWPATTTSVATKRDTRVYDAVKGDKIGKIAKGRRLAWKRIVSTKDRCKAWLELEPRGWVCAKDVQPSDLAPSVDAPDVMPASGRFADIRGASADAYDSKADIKAGVVKQVVPGETFVAVRDQTIRVGGTKYYKTDKGFIASDKLRWLSPSDFEGLDLVATPPISWPFAWVTPAKKGGTVWARATPKRKGKKVRELQRRELVSVLETKKKFARIGDGEWVALSELRVARVVAPPDGVGANERWIDVDLDQQVLIAYQGSTPVFATLVSTGRKKFPTPTGAYRIARKYTKTRMRNPKASASSWDVAEVPWAMKFRKNFALHGAYWHDGFGKVKSHGCVNLSPRDAQRVFDWVQPEIAEGWTEVEDDGDAGTGTVIRIRSKRDPKPKWRSFDGKRLGKQVASR